MAYAFECFAGRAAPHAHSPAPRPSRRHRTRSCLAHAARYAVELLEPRLAAEGIAAAVGAELALATPATGAAALLVDQREQPAGLLDGMTHAAQPTETRPLPLLDDLPPLADLLSGGPLAQPPRAATLSSETTTTATTSAKPKPTSSVPLATMANSCGTTCGTVYVSVYATLAAYEQGETSGNFHFTATYSGCFGSQPPASVHVEFTLGGVATPEADYDGTDILLRYVDVPVYGSKDVSFRAIDDGSPEDGAESVLVGIAPGGDYEVDVGLARSDVIDNDPLVWMTTAKDYATEGATAPDGQADAVVFTVWRTDYWQSPLTVNYKIAPGGTAKHGPMAEGGDYGPLNLSVEIPAGADHADVRVSPHNDQVKEWTEWFGIELQPGFGYGLRGGTFASSGTGEFVDDDGVSLTVADVVQVNNDDDDGNHVSDKDDTGPVSGENDLLPLDLAFPQEVKQGATVTLSAATGRVKVWQDGSKSQALLGGTTSSHTWTVGSDTVPNRLWVEGMTGSSGVGDIVFTFSGTDATATSPPAHPTSTSDEKRSTGIGISINQFNPSLDVTGKQRDWLVGQMVNLLVVVDAPAAWRQAPTYAWTVPGNKLRDYVVDSTTATAVQLGALHDGNAQEARNGTQQSALKFFWVANSAGVGPELQTVTVAVGNINGQSYSASTKFNVYEPSHEGTATQGTAGFNTNHTQIGLFTNGGFSGMSFNARVQMPAAFADQGQWIYAQRWNRRRNANYKDGRVVRSPSYGQWGLDTSFPYPAPSDDAYTGIGYSTGAGFHQTFDTPRLPLSVNYADCSIDDQFQMFLMFKPPGADSRWVPLRKVEWDFHVSAVQQASGWQLSGNPGQNKGAFADTAEVPEWPVVHKNTDPWETVPPAP